MRPPESREELASLLADREVWRVRHRACLKFLSLSRRMTMMRMMIDDDDDDD